MVRRGDERMGQAYGGGANDALPARGEVGQHIRALVERGVVRLVTGWRTDRVEQTPEGLVVHAGERTLDPVDEIIVTTGLRPDLAPLAELRLGIDPAVEAPTALAPLIDPNYHSCGTVRPHGVDELSHPERGFFIVGMKSYGRAPTFLLLTGYEQVRSVTAALAGDWDAARRVELLLPETGVCSGPVAAGGATTSGCCDPAQPALPSLSVFASAAASLISLEPVPAAASHIGLKSAPATCCAPAVQVSCCEPEDKGACCGTAAGAPAGATCGCQDG